MPDNQPKKALIVDDDEFLLEMYSLKFKDSGFDIDIAKSGSEALDKIRESKNYDVLLLDIVMPSPDGFEVLSTIKKEKLLPKCLIIALTNLGQKEDVEKGKMFGADDYIVKAHYTPSEVVAKVKQLLAK
jgi:DNA-binding response OmpR family regulator